MKKLFWFPLLGSLVFCAACGSNNGGSTPVGVGAGAFSNASLKGQYVYRVAGVDLNNNGAPYRESGVFVADGNGNITGGTDDFNELSVGFSSNSVSGTYNVASDGTGTLTLTVAGSAIDLAMTLVSTNQAYLIETDTFANGSGSAVLQNASAISAIPGGNFTFRMHTVNTTESSSLVGAIALSGTSITGSEDVLRGTSFDNGTSSPLTLTGTVSSPDTTGRGTGTITDSSAVTTNFIYYIVDSNNVRFLESDSGTIAEGRAERRGSSFSAGSLSGNFAFGSRADDSTNLDAVATVGRFSSNGAGSISSGEYDFVQDGNSSVAQTFTGSYTMATNGRAAVTLTTPAGTVQQFFWMVNSTRAYFVTNSATKVEDGTLDQQTGSFSNSVLKGQYAFVMDGFNLSASEFVDRVGWISWSGSGSLNWNETVNDSGAAQQPGILAGTYAVSGNGRATASVNNLSIASNDIVFYLTSGSSGYILQNDPGVELIGAMSLQQQ